VWRFPLYVSLCFKSLNKHNVQSIEHILEIGTESNDRVNRYYFLSTTSSSASLAIVRLENDPAADRPTILDGRLTGLAPPWENRFDFGLLGTAGGVGLPVILFLFKFCTRFCTLPEEPRGPLAATLGPRIPVDWADPERVMEDFPAPNTMSPSAFTDAGGDGLREETLLGVITPLLRF